MSFSVDSAKASCEQYLTHLVNGDLDGVLALFSDQATVEDPVGTEIRRGKAALREFYRVACDSVIAGTLTGEPRIAGLEVAFPFVIDIDAGGRRMAIDIIDVFRFNDAGQIVQMRAFWSQDNMRPAG